MSLEYEEHPLQKDGMTMTFVTNSESTADAKRAADRKAILPLPTINWEEQDEQGCGCDKQQPATNDRKQILPLPTMAY